MFLHTYAHTYAGNREVGIRQGTAGWLDVNAMVGNVRNELGTATAPEKAEQIVKARAHQNR